ncbi:MAG: outer membrane beta-barrel protein [Rikenellaceae bacterium]
MREFQKIFLMVALVLAAAGVEAKTLSIGVSGGVNSSSFSIKGNKSAITNNMGYQASVALDVQIPMFSISPELRFVSNSFDIQDASILGSDDASVKIRSTAIDVPVVLGWTIVGPLKLEVGPRFTIMDKAKAKSGGEKYDVGGVRSNTGYILGLKLTIAKKIVVGARFNGQFANPVTDLNFGGAEYKIRNYSYGLSVGFKM